MQTQVTGLNDRGVTVGFWSGQNTASESDNNFGFYASGGRFHQVNFPASAPARPPVDQRRGVNDSNVAVGYFTNGPGSSRGYEYNIKTGPLQPGPAARHEQHPEPDRDGHQHLRERGRVLPAQRRRSQRPRLPAERRPPHQAGLPRGRGHLPPGVNNSGEVVGTYPRGTGASSSAHGFTWTRGGGFRTVDDPGGPGDTFINGVNDHGVLVGGYFDKAGNAHGLLATP